MASELTSGQADVEQKSALLVYLPLLDSIVEGALIVDREGFVVAANEAAAAVFGVARRGELLRPLKDYPRWFEPRASTGEQATPIAARALAGEVVHAVERAIRTPAGVEKRLRTSAAPLRTESGIVGAVVLITDISTARAAEIRADQHARALEAALAERDRVARELQTVLDTAPVAVFITHDAEGRHIVGNRYAADALRMPPGANVSMSAPPEERQPSGLRIMRSGEDIPPTVMPVQMAARGIPVRDWECDFVFPDGTVRHMVGSAEPLVGPDGSRRGSVAVFLDITARKQMEDELREASRRKDEFLSLLSHELRNPLAPISNSLFILEHAEPTGQQARHAKEVISRQVGHLTRLVDDLLEVTRITRGKVKLRTARLDLGELVRRTGEDHRDLLRKRGLDFAVDTPRQQVLVDGDKTRLAQVVGNLLHNAAKFTPTGGKVTLSVIAVDGAAELHVIDTGTGIAPALLRRVFEPFVQAEQTLARTEGGLGLGLALVKGMVELHGGTVEARSAGEGQGSEFIVRLPTVAAPEADRQDGGRLRAGHRVLRVLVVEDNVDAAESLAEVVKMYGHEVQVAYDGPSAIALATAVVPDLVLCDIGLPGMDGYDVAHALRTDPNLRTVRLVAVTGYAQPEDVQRAIEAGFTGHIAKPPALEALEQYLATTSR